MTPSLPTFRVVTVGAFTECRALAAPVPLQTAAETATAAAMAAMTQIRRDVVRVSTAITLDKERQMRRILPVLIGLAVVATAATIATASTGGLPNIGNARMTAEPIYKGYYDGHIDTYVLTDVSSKSQAAAMHINYSAELKA